ncbi:MAG: flagellar P-ring protein precursor FlgI [Planctomycetota bacterium]|jgi:flagellar P-ring protein precursor FlgI
MLKTAILLLSALQAGPQATDPAGPSGSTGQEGSAQVGIYPTAIEAPTQPQGRSSSRVVTGPRLTPTPGRGTEGRVMVRVRDMVAVRGEERNVVQGMGLVVGLAGTGDSSNAARVAILNYLKTQNFNVSAGDVNSKNVALVLVQADIQASVKPGRKIDVRVSSFSDCDSLVGGTLLQTELTGMGGTTVYATCAGSVTTGAFSASGEAASAVRNHLTVGRIPLGGKVERAVETQLVSDNGFVYLDLMALKGSFGNAVRIADAIDDVFPGSAIAEDAMTVAVRVPEGVGPRMHVAFLNALLEREIEPEAFARVVVNERTGVIIMGEGVRITRGAITKGNVTVSIAETPEASQPGALSGGETEVLPRSDLLIEEENRALTIVNGAVTLQEVVEVLNVLGVTPRDMIDILTSMSQAGMLHAELVVL